MRWTTGLPPRKKVPRSGETKIVEKFLWIPFSIKHYASGIGIWREWFWLEKVRMRYVYLSYERSDATVTGWHVSNFLRRDDDKNE